MAYTGRRFLAGIGNPNTGGESVRRPTNRVSPGSGNAPTSSYSGGASYGNYLGNTPFRGQRAPRDRTQTRTYSGHGPLGSLNRGGSGFVWDRPSSASFNEPDIPDERVWEGDKWQGEKWQGGVADTTALIDATDALINEQLGGTMSEAARRFGQLGGLQSGGGLGGGYAGTLAESERGAMRDRAEMRHRYRFQAEQADAERNLRAHEGYENRGLSAHEGYEGRRFGAHGMGADYDRWKYGAELGQSERARMDEMMALYGM